MFRFYFVSFLLQSYFVLGQANDLKQNQILFGHYAQDKGFSQETSYTMAPYDDFMWFDMQEKEGFNRFDGYGFKVFRLGGTNIPKNNRIWNENAPTISVFIMPLFWKTWWFRAGLIVLLFGGMYGVYRYRIYQLKDRQVHELSVSIKAQELERQRFAQELHDGVGANLALLKMYLHSIGDPKISPDELKNRSVNLLKDSIEEIRRLIHDMHPRSLMQCGLVGTVDEMTKRINDSQQLTVSFESQQVDQKLPENVEINLFRVVQELLQNTLKHANATNVWLSILCESNTLFLRYRDNGCGVDTVLLNKKNGNGLVNMQQRIELLKGTYQLASAENAGTTVEISVPIPA